MQVFAWVFFMLGGVNPEAAIYITKNQQECMEMQAKTAQYSGGKSFCKYTMILTEKQK